MFKQSLQRMLFGVVAAVAFSAAAHASTIVLPTSGPGPTLNIGDIGQSASTVASGSFSIDYFFQLSGTSGLHGAAFDASALLDPIFDITSIQASLYQGATLIASGLVSATQSLFQVASLAGGAYDLRVTGVAASPNGGFFRAGVLVGSPVPLPAAAWLLLSGLAGVGAFARRRSSGLDA